MTEKHPARRIILIIILSWVTLGVMAIIAFCCCMCIYATSIEYYETTDVADYGSYIGNYDNETPIKYIESFFPESIDDSFEDVKYVYRAKKFDAYGYEAYLEFTIQDVDSFTEYVDSITEEGNWKPFQFDADYMEYSVDDYFEIYPKNDPYRISIEYAKIGKVLYSLSEQRIIYVAIGVYDGGGTYASELHEFFDRFDIDPVAYAEAAKNGRVW